MIENKIEIKPISELLGMNFFIPRYQRGYRWGEQEITELLDDILQYSNSVGLKNNEMNIGNFYCLQPIVVKENNFTNSTNEIIERWEVIDGQQRLTTLFIILTYLKDIRQFYDNKTEIYNIDFETRDKCSDFFQREKFIQGIDYSNVDFYHISKGYEYVKTWFEDGRLTSRLVILKTILDTEKNVSIIWYKSKENIINEENDSIDLFTRLNEGKIPLTDAELIKALLLQSDKYPVKDDKYIKQRLFEIASEWDEIEATLQDEKIWLFLNNTSYQPTSKIEFIFNFLAEKWNKENDFISKEKPKHFEYLIFDKYLSKKHKDFSNEATTTKDILTPINEIWKEIKDLFSLFKEWYEDHRLYHYIGYLIAIDKNLSIEKFINKNLSKKDFEYFLKEKIAESIKVTEKKENSEELKSLSELSYGKDDDKIRNILLLFNVESLIAHNKENARFPFHLYKKEKITSIEHIHPQNPDKINSEKERSLIWIKSHKRRLELFNTDSKQQKSEIKEIIKELDILEKDYENKVFENIYPRVIEFYSEIAEIKESEVHTLYNLALVDKDTNSSLNNSFFDIKREILKTNKLKKYVPICTQRVFSKYYSSNPSEMIFWSDNDRKEYFGEIEKIYNSFTETLGK
jgi:uncharacterized protein with ParB-like and HNH nuclease domain